MCAYLFPFFHTTPTIPIIPKDSRALLGINTYYDISKAYSDHSKRDKRPFENGVLYLESFEASFTEHSLGYYLFVPMEKPHLTLMNELEVITKVCQTQRLK